MKKTVLITGASSGFGRETAKLFHTQGWNVIATMRSPEKETELNTLGDILITKLDVTDKLSIQNAVAAGTEKFGRIDVLVNNAGYGAMGALEAAGEEEIKKQFDVNLFGLIAVTQAVLPGMRQQGSGTIINLSSIGGRVTFPFCSLYHATKFAVEGLTESMQYELNPLGINLKIVEPGGYKTEFAGRSMSLFGVNGVDAYQADFDKFMAMIAAWPMSENIGEVAEAIYEAATDGTEKLRYPVGHDSAPILQARHDMADADFKKDDNRANGYLKTDWLPRVRGSQFYSNFKITKMMTDKYIDLQSISDLHKMVHYTPPRHPLISVIDHTDFYANHSMQRDVFYRFGFYTISCKKFDGILKYGKGYYDFSEGSLLFTAPGQVLAPGPDVKVEEGWALFIHPDLIHGTDLGRKIHQYSFFNYETNEALHISEEEKLVIKDCVAKIEKEYSQNIDKHSQGLIVSNIELLLNYCNRFYDRQFYTRAKINSDVVQQFETLLKDYFLQDTLIESGLPNVKYFASRLNLSPNYLSDLLNKFTGKTTQEHIHLELIDKAKSMLWSTNNSISEIAYGLGFEHPSHFTKIFKSKTGKSPSEYRHLN